jgi:hypothetical protein
MKLTFSMDRTDFSSSAISVSSSQGLTSRVTTDFPTAAGPLAAFFSL